MALLGGNEMFQTPNDILNRRFQCYKIGYFWPSDCLLMFFFFKNV